MDKLKPIITHHFWLVFLVTLGLPPAAWWMTSGALTEQIQARESKLNTDFSGISSGNGIPNDDWISGVDDRIGIREEQNELALDRLWQAQVGLMIWPPNVRKYMEECPYRGELENERVRQILPDLYRDDYQREVHRVWMLTEPTFDGQVRPDKGNPQKLFFPYASMPRVPDGKWQLLPPTWAEIWNSQEDLWLLSELFKAVQRVNAPTTGIVDSYIKRITMVELFGGARIADEDIGGDAGNASGGPGGDTDMGPGGMGPGSMGPGGIGLGGRRPGLPGAGTSIRTQPAVFEMTEEYKVFGADAKQRIGGGIFSGGPSSAEMDGGSGSGDGEDGATDDPNLDENRYVAAERAYRTRGFRLQVTIHQMQVPELIRELLNSKYPVEIIRFQQMALNPDEPGLTTRTNVAGPGQPMGLPGTKPGAGFPASGPGAAETFDAGSEATFDPGQYTEGGENPMPADSEEASSEMIQVALRELDVVDLVVVGELYLYNSPIIDADGDGVPDEVPAEGTDPAAASSPTVDTAVPATPAEAGAPAAVPGTTPVPTPGTAPTPGASPTPGAAPATPAPGTAPAAVVPPGETPAEPPADAVPAPPADAVPAPPANAIPAPPANAVSSPPANAVPQPPVSGAGSGG